MASHFWRTSCFYTLSPSLHNLYLPGPMRVPVEVIPAVGPVVGTLVACVPAESIHHHLPPPSVVVVSDSAAHAPLIQSAQASVIQR